MSIWIPADIENEIRRKIASGRYRDDADVLRAAMQALDALDRREQLRAALAEGEQGEGIPYSAELMDEIVREADEADRQGLPLNPDICA
jgi:putative addiction module CopG family antidote